MNKFFELKQILTNKQVVEKYLGQAKKHNSTGNWYISPFRDEKTASFCVSDKGIHDFGDSQHYDIISFVQKYFDTTVNKAYEIICNDFGIRITNEYESKKTLELIKKKREEEQKIRQKIDDWYRNTFINICNEKLINDKLIERYSKKHDFLTLKILYDNDLKLQLLLEDFENKDKTNLYLERN